MKDWLLSLLQKMLAQKLASMFVLLLPIQTALLIYLREGIANYLSDPTGLISLVSIGTTLSTVSLALASYFWFRPKLKPLPWGVHQDIKTGSYFCSKCFLAHKKHNPLYSKDGNRWNCSVCSCYRFDPDFKEPEQPSSPPPHDQSWMA